MPITVRFDPNSINQQVQIIEDATPTSDGGMSKAQAAKLAALTPGNSGVQSISVTAPIVSSGGETPNISIAPATTSTPGSMSPTDKQKVDALPSSGFGIITVTSTEAVAVGQIVEVDIAYLQAHPGDPLRYRVWRHTGGSPSAAGSAATACSGAGASFTIVVGQVISLVTFWSDGTGSIHPGDPVGFSSLIDGGVVASGVPYLGTCVSPTTIGPVVGAAVPVWRSIT